jgi:hypothetical protein
MDKPSVAGPPAERSALPIKAIIAGARRPGRRLRQLAASTRSRRRHGPGPATMDAIGRAEPGPTKQAAQPPSKPCILGLSWNLHTFKCGSTAVRPRSARQPTNLFEPEGSSPNPEPLAYCLTGSSPAHLLGCLKRHTALSRRAAPGDPSAAAAACGKDVPDMGTTGPHSSTDQHHSTRNSPRTNTMVSTQLRTVRQRSVGRTTQEKTTPPQSSEPQFRLTREIHIRTRGPSREADLKLISKIR